MAFPTTREIVEETIKLLSREWVFAPNAVNNVLKEIDKRVARKPDIDMVNLIARLVNKNIIGEWHHGRPHHQD